MSFISIYIHQDHEFDAFIDHCFRFNEIKQSYQKI